MPVDSSSSDGGLERYRDYLRMWADSLTDRRLRGKIDLSGVVQQTLFEAHQALDDIMNQPSDQQMAYLRRVLANNLNDEIRKLRTDKRDVRREQSLEAAIEQSSMNLQALLAGHGSLPGARIEREERALKLTAALGKLPVDQREALVLQHWRGYSLAEIAEEMGRTRDAVAGLIRRGMRQLRAENQSLVD